MEVQMSEGAAALLQEYIDASYGFTQCSTCNLFIDRSEIAAFNDDKVICKACFENGLPEQEFEQHKCFGLPAPRDKPVSIFAVNRERQVSMSMCSTCGEQFERPDGAQEFRIWAAGWNAGKWDVINGGISMPDPFTPGWIKKFEEV